jgi:NADPH:quinone reductase-like Zn-dependent oxidoreductase
MYWPIIGAGRTPVDTVYLPSSIGDLAISCKISDVTKKAGDSMQAFCKGALPNSDLLPFHGSMFATATDSEEVLISMKNLAVSPIVEHEAAPGSGVARELCYKLEWETVVLPRPEISDICNGMTNGDHMTLNGVPDGIPNSTTNGVPSTSNALFRSELLIVHGNGPYQIQLASEIAKSVKRLTSNRPSLERFATLNTEKISGKLCLVISELECPILASLTSTNFTILQKLVTNSEGILWVVCGAYVSSSNPDANMITGLSRSICSETLLRFATLDLDPQSLNTSNIVQPILSVLQAVFSPKAGASCELEFMERKGVLSTPRIVVDAEMNEYVHKETQGGSALEVTWFKQEGRPLKMAMVRPGAVDTLHFVDQILDEPLASDEIEVEVKAIGMNSHDIDAIDTTKFGIECSGVVTKIGNNITNLVVGNRVACLSVDNGVYSTYTRTKARFAFQVNDDLDFQNAASIPIAHCTAYYSLINLGRLLKNERVLINGAWSAVGEAAICLAQHLGAEVFTIVRSIESKAYLMKTSGLTEDRISLGMPEQADSADFDIVLNCVSADPDTVRGLRRSLSNFGRFVEVKDTESHSSSRFDTRGLQNNQSFMSMDLMSIALQRPKVMERLLSEVSALLKQGNIPSLHLTSFSMSDVELAFNSLRNGNVDGKLVVLPQTGAMVKVCTASPVFEMDRIPFEPRQMLIKVLQATPWNKGQNSLRPDVSYILIGGTGGLGRSIAKWMVDGGARNLILISRTGTVAGKVKKLIAELTLVGAKVIVKRCDVSDSASVNTLIHKDIASMPKVKGIVHGAMVLNVSPPSFISPASVYSFLLGCSLRENELRAVYHCHRSQGPRSLELSQRTQES